MKGDLRMNNVITRKLFSLILVPIMVVGMCPLAALADVETPLLESAAVTVSGNVELTFDREMAAPGSGGAGFTVVGYGGQNKGVIAAELDAANPAKILLTLSNTIKGGEAPWLSYAPGTVQAESGGMLAQITGHTITNALPHPVLNTAAPPEGTVGTAYTYTFTAGGGTPPYLFFCESGSLPAGLSLSQNGTLSGTPTNAGSFGFHIKVLDSNAALDRKSFFHKINPTPTAVCEVSSVPTKSYTSLADALAAVEDGQTITLLQNINHTNGIVIDGKTVFFNLAGYTLNVTGSGTGLEVKNGGNLKRLGSSGELNVTGSGYGVIVAGSSSSAAVTHITSSDTGAYITGGGQLTVSGNITANSIGVVAIGPDTSVAVMGNTTGGVGGSGADAVGGASVTVGNIVSTGGANSYGARVATGGTVTVEGTITGSLNYVSVDSATKTIDDKTAPTTKQNYHTYTGTASTVWVKDTTASTNVCAIGSTEYATLGEALAAVTDSIPTTIRILAHINHTAAVQLINKNITFDLNGNTVNISTTATAVTALIVNGGSLSLAGDGALNISGKSQGVHVNNNGTATVTNALRTGDSTGNAAAAYTGGTLTVLNDATATAYSGCAALAATGGSVTVYGNARSAWMAAYAESSGVVHIKGNATATATGADGAGAFAFNGGTIIIDGEITADRYIRVGSIAKSVDDKNLPTTKEGYHTYTDNTSTVWVKGVEEPITTYTVTVNGSNAETTGADSYAQGAIVTIDAGSREGYRFTGWTSPDGVTFENADRTTTTFIMPEKNISVTATWSYVVPAQDGKATPIATSLSTPTAYADPNEPDTIPKTSDGSFPLWLGLIAVVTMSGSLVLIRRIAK